MSAASRRKGLTGEREVAELFTAAGFELRGLEGAGDWLAYRAVTTFPKRRSVTVQLETKRYHDRARIPEWWTQASTEATMGAPPLLCTRADRGEWLVTLRLADLLDVIA